MKRTPKHVVRKRWPNAYAYQWAGPKGWIIYTGEMVNVTLGQGASAARAWHDAKVNGARR